MSISPENTVKTEKQEKTLTLDLHPLYASILQDGAVVKQGEVLGLDVELRRVLVAPFTGVARLLVTGNGPERKVRVFLTEPSRSAGTQQARSQRLTSPTAGTPLAAGRN